MEKIKVQIVDDSAVVRKALSAVFSSDPAFEVLPPAADPIFAMAKMEKSWPTVIVLDIEMPRMDGITFLKKIMSEHPTPVVICSTLTEKGAETTMEALASGAVDIITKPKLGTKGFFEESSKSLIQTVKAAAQARVRKRVSTSQRVKVDELIARPKHTADVVLSQADGRALAKTTEKVVAIGTSTGGTSALETILVKLPKTSPGIVVVQHMPEKFTAAFAARLNSLSAVEVKEAENRDVVRPGRVLIAPGGMHMMLKRSGAQYIVEVVDGPLVSRHRPSVDVLFRSVAKYAGKNALGIIMTGMGDDGATGLLEMHQAGAYTVAQDEESCVVYGMPKEAVKKGAVDISLSLFDLPAQIIKYSNKSV